MITTTIILLCVVGIGLAICNIALARRMAKLETRLGSTAEMGVTDTKNIDSLFILVRALMAHLNVQYTPEETIPGKFIDIRKVKKG